MRAEPCACGGFVVATPTDDVLVMFACQRHNATYRHQLWRARREAGE